jgi:hypothetical protein
MSDVDATVSVVLAEVQSARDYSQPRNVNDLFLSSETIISGLAYLVGPMLDAEQAYRARVQALIDEGASVSGAEARARSEDGYYVWKKIERACELGEQQIMILKKFGTLLESENRRS